MKGFFEVVKDGYSVNKKKVWDHRKLSRFEQGN
jgi:hypothetical protein